MSLLRTLAIRSNFDQLRQITQQVLQDNLVGDNVVLMTKDPEWNIHSICHCVDCDGEAETKETLTGHYLCGGCALSRHERNINPEN